jgi:hypothetical protein
VFESVFETVEGRAERAPFPRPFFNLCHAPQRTERAIIPILVRARMLLFKEKCDAETI